MCYKLCMLVLFYFLKMFINDSLDLFLLLKMHVPTKDYLAKYSEYISLGIILLIHVGKLFYPYKLPESYPVYNHTCCFYSVLLSWNGDSEETFPFSVFVKSLKTLPIAFLNKMDHSRLGFFCFVSILYPWNQWTGLPVVVVWDHAGCWQFWGAVLAVGSGLCFLLETFIRDLYITNCSLT